MHERSLPLPAPFEGVDLAYTEWGEPTRERVVLCVHGLTRNARDFDMLAQRLAASGVRVIAVDVAGRGRSSWLSDPQHYSVPIYAQQLVQLLDHLGIATVDWIGTSMGGLIGLVVAATLPQRVARLVLNDIGPFVPSEALRQIQAYLHADHEFASFAELEAHLRSIHASFGPLSDAQWRHLAEHSAMQDRGRWRLRYDPKIVVPYDALAEGDIALWEVWDKITCPALVLRGLESAVLPCEVAEQMRRSGPRAEVVEFHGVGHAPALMADDQIMTIVDWLGSDRDPDRTLGERRAELP